MYSNLCTFWKYFPQFVQSWTVPHIDTVFTEILPIQTLDIYS